MNGISSNYYLDYSSLFNSVGSSGSGYYDIQQAYNKDFSKYGVNNSTLTAAQASSVVDFRSAAQTLQNSLNSLLSKKADGGSIFGGYKAASSDTEALTATYNNNINKYSSEALLARRDPSYKPVKPEELSVKTVQLAQTQKNVGDALSSKDMALEAGKTYRFEIVEGDKTTAITFVTENGDTNESVMKKIAAAVNDKNIGVKASVNTNSVSGTSSLVFESRETGIKEGAERAFTVADVSGYDAAEKLGLNNMTQEAQNAKYYVMKNGDAKLEESMSNDVKLSDRTSATLKKVTDDYVKIGFENDSRDGINAVREMVNGFNALFDVASSGGTTQSGRLAEQLQGLADTYSKSLAEVGITRDANGYFVINEDKMQSAADSGKLENLFSADDKATSYGFAKRLQNIANSVADNPYQYVTGGSKADEGGSEQNFWDKINEDSPTGYSKLYFDMLRYENMGSLFNSMF